MMSEEDRNQSTQIGGRAESVRVGTRQTAETSAGNTRQPMSMEGVRLNGLLSNRLLAALPGDDFARLLPYLEPVFLSARQNLYRGDEKVRFAYFPENAVVTPLHIFSDGNTAEASMIGRDGMVGLSAIFGAQTPGRWTQVLVHGNAFRVRTETLKQEFARGGALQRLLLGYAAARLSQLSQRAACNGRHKLESRFCTWLLMVHDRAGDEQLLLTQELISKQLGARRAGVTQLANALSEREIISCGRGRIRVRDRRALEEAACECYRTLKLN